MIDKCQLLVSALGSSPKKTTPLDCDNANHWESLAQALITKLWTSRTLENWLPLFALPREASLSNSSPTGKSLRSTGSGSRRPMLPCMAIKELMPSLWIPKADATLLSINHQDLHREAWVAMQVASKSCHSVERRVHTLCSNSLGLYFVF